MQFAFELFSDIFTYRDNALTRVNPRVKVIVAFLTVIGVISCSKVEFPLMVFCLALAGMIAIRLPFRLILARLAAPLGIVLVLVVLQSILVGSTPLFTFTLFGWHVSAMQEGAWRGILIASRVLGGVSVIILMSTVTPAHQLFHTLRWLGLPKGWVEVATLMYRYIFILLDRAADGMVAQRVRLGYSGLRRSLSSLGTLAGSVIVLSIDQATRTHEAMTVRGYKGQMPFGALPAMSKKDGWIMGVVLGILLCSYLLIEWGPV